MTRWILLGLRDDEVDAISRVPREHPGEEIVVYHPDPGALVLTLAELAELPRVAEPPEPRADQWVVVVGGAGREAGLEEGWRRLGATILESGASGGNGAARADGSGSGGLTAPGPAFDAALPAIAPHDEDWAERLASRPDLAAALVNFTDKVLK